MSELLKFVNDEAKKQGFEKVNRYFFAKQVNCITLLWSAEKSRHGNSLLVDIGGVHNDFPEKNDVLNRDSPRNFGMRLQGLVSNRLAVLNALNPDFPMDEELRKMVLSTAIEKAVRIWGARWSDPKYLRKLAKRNDLTEQQTLAFRRFILES